MYDSNNPNPRARDAVEDQVLSEWHGAQTPTQVIAVQSASWVLP
jgi:hypothetical protein